MVRVSIKSHTDQVTVSHKHRSLCHTTHRSRVTQASILFSCHTSIDPVSHKHRSRVTQASILSLCHTSIDPVSHKHRSYPYVTQASIKCHTSIDQVSQVSLERDTYHTYCYVQFYMYACHSFHEIPGTSISFSSITAVSTIYTSLYSQYPPGTLDLLPYWNELNSSRPRVVPRKLSFTEFIDVVSCRRMQWSNTWTKITHSGIPRRLSPDFHVILKF